MQYLTLYVVLLVLILLCFLRGKDHLFKLIIMVYPTMVIYKALVEYFTPQKINTLFGQSVFINNLIIFLLILIPVYIALMRIIDTFRIHKNIKGVGESLLLSLGVVLLTIGICFHILPDKDVFSLDKPFEIFLGQVYQASNRKRISDYMIMPVYSYKGKIRMPLEFSQLPNPKFFNFKEDSSFVFLVFKSYEDTIFSSCFLFGKKENMGSYLKLTEDFCNPIEKPRGGSCERIYSPVCGCDYIEYGNECEAEVENWVDGPCKLHLCKPKHGPIANCRCLMPYWPVCGCNGVTYGNECEANCNGIYNFTRGECK